MAHSPRVKAQALALLLTGESQRAVARELGIPLSTVHLWRHRLLPLYAPKLHLKKAVMIDGQPYRWRFSASTAVAELSDAPEVNRK